MAGTAEKTGATGELLAGERAVVGGQASGPANKGSVPVRGEILRSLLSGALPWPEGPPRRLVLTGLAVAGGLDIAGLGTMSVRSLRLVGCRFEGALVLDGLELESLELEDCEAPSLSLAQAAVGRVTFDRLSTRGHVKLDGLKAGSIELRRSRIAGVLSFAGVDTDGDLALRDSVVGTGKTALQGDHARIGRRLLLDRDARADGAVTLTAATIDSLKVRAGAVVGGPLVLGRACLGDVRIEAGARLASILGGNLKVAADLVVESEHRCEGGPAIDLSVLEVAGDVLLGAGFLSDAPVRLSGCVIGGALTLRGGLTVAAGNGLDISRLRCGRLELDFGLLEGGISLRQVECAGLVLAGEYRCPADLPLHLGVHCSGRVSLGAGERSTRIAGTLSLIGHRCQEMTFRNLEIKAGTEGRWAGVAVAARHLEVETYLRFGRPSEGQAVTIEGVVALDHARLGDDVRFAGARIAAPPASAVGSSGEALSLRRARLQGDLEFGGLEAAGSVDLAGVEVGGDVRLSGLAGSPTGEECRLDLQSVSIGGALRVSGLTLKGAWTVDLGDASVERLDDDHGRAWAAGADVPPRMEIASLRYADIEGLTEGRRRQTEDAVSARLAWIETHARAAHGRGAGFSPQPYRTLVSVLAEAGHDNGVKRTELAARRQQRRLGSAPWALRLGGGLLELTSGYGYAPMRAAAALALYFLLGWAGVSLADQLHAFETSPFIDGSVLAVAAVKSPNGCPWLIPPLFALDLMVPLTTLGNENFCSIRPEALVWNWLAVGYRLFGWVLLSIALLTFSGVMKREV